jgi:hypothetical protein
MNFTTTVQAQALFQANATPNGDGWSTDVFARRTRISLGGNVNSNFGYYFQVDNANFGKYGNFTGRMVVQDAFFNWAPMGSTGDTVIFIDAGIIYAPFARLELTTIGSGLTVEGHPDTFRGFSGTFYTANRSTGIDVRGWAMHKKLGFRFAVVEGSTPNAADPGINPNRNPGLGGLVNIDFLASEEGSFLYQSIYFAKEPILSLAIGGYYQSKALKVAKGYTDQKALSATLFLDYPMSEANELIFILAGYRFGNGSGSKDTGIAASVDLGYRMGFLKPYVGWEIFTSDDCPSDITIPAQCSGVHTADSRNFKVGLDLFINKTQNHVMLEFGINHGQSTWGPQSYTVANAGYIPLSLDPLTPGQPRRAMSTSLTAPAQQSLLLHWNIYF